MCGAGWGKGGTGRGAELVRNSPQSPTMSKLAAREEEEAAVGYRPEVKAPDAADEGCVPVKPEGGTLGTCLTSTFSEFQRVLTLSLHGVQPAHHASAYCSLSGFSWLRTNYCGIPVLGPQVPIHSALWLSERKPLTGCLSSRRIGTFGT